MNNIISTGGALYFTPPGDPSYPIPIPLIAPYGVFGDQIRFSFMFDHYYISAARIFGPKVSTSPQGSDVLQRQRFYSRTQPE